MAIIKPSPVFEGSEMTAGSYGRIIKEGVRTVSFREEKNRGGNYFFVLPPYKVDARGNGVWFKAIKTRVDFGLEPKESYLSLPDDPVNYFVNNAKMHYPDYCVIEEVVINGKKMKKHPSYGRIANKVIYNVAYVSELSAGCHVLTTPEHYVGATIEAWGRTRGPNGELRPMLNDYENAVPIKLQLRKEAIGQPWLIEIDASSRYKLPVEMADTDYLYNLDDVLYVTPNDYILSKLQAFTPSDIFNRCMQGYFKTNSIVNPGIPHNDGDLGPVAQPATFTTVPTQSLASTLMPKATIAPASAAPTVNAAPVPVTSQAPVLAPAFNMTPPVPHTEPSTPTASIPLGQGMSIQNARNFLLTPK